MNHFSFVCGALVLGLASAAREGAGGNTTVPCAGLAMYKEQAMCTPAACGTRNLPGFFTEDSAEALLKLAKKGFAVGRASGPASILDLHQGAVSHKESFINYHLMAERVKEKVATGDPKEAKLAKVLIHAEELEHLRAHIRSLKSYVLAEYGLQEDTPLYLATPCFFSQIDDKDPLTEHDRYFETHIDTQQYGTFVFTTLSYLTTQGDHFEGGSLVIDGQEVRPAIGTVVAFTSGSENPHNVERVTKGTRYTLTVAFTCAPPPTGVRIDEAFAAVPLRDTAEEAGDDKGATKEKAGGEESEL